MASEKRCNYSSSGSQEPSSKSRSIIGPPKKKLKSHKYESALVNQGEELSSADIGPPCYISLLPNEVLEMILAYNVSSFHDWKQIRQVCKLWYQVSTRLWQDDVHIRDMSKIWRASSSLEHFENCALKHLDLCFTAYEVKKFPITMWEKIGIKIRSLQFRGCQLGDKTMKKIILCCPNLQSLRIFLEFRLKMNAKFAICSAEMLKELSIVRNELQTFEIGVRRRTMRREHQFPLIRNVDAIIWRQIFAAFFEVFPNVVHIKWSKIFAHSEVFQCAFTRNEVKTSDNLVIASILALSLAGNSWSEPFSIPAALRLSSFSLSASEYLVGTLDDTSPILKFLEKLEKLKFVKINFFTSNFVEPMETLLFKILNNCPELQDLEYFGDNFWLHHSHINDENKLSRLFTSLPSMLETLSISNIVLDLNSFSLSSCPSFHGFDRCIPRLDQKVLQLDTTLSIIHRYCPIELQHLTMHIGLTDSTLQIIFKYFTNLRTLSIKLHPTASNFGITGRAFESPNTIPGYSIGRLQELEKLEIGYQRIHLDIKRFVSEEILTVFHLPCLQHLSYMLPRTSSTFILIGRMMPQLKSIHFESSNFDDGKISRESLLALCEYSRNLHSVHFDGHISLSQARKMAIYRPSLKVIHANNQIFRYHEQKKLMVREPH